MRPLAPDFKTYIFGILPQFVTIWHQQKRWVFFFEYGPLQDPCEVSGSLLSPSSPSAPLSFVDLFPLEGVRWDLHCDVDVDDV